MGDEQRLPVDTDILVQNIESQPELNGLGGRIVGYRASNERYTVRLHFTGRVLSLKRHCCGETIKSTVAGETYIGSPDRVESSDKMYMTNDDEIYPAAVGTIRRRPALRKELSMRACQGLKTKGPGALVMNLYRVDDVYPSQCASAEELLSPEQTTFLSNQEMRAKFGRAFTKGRSETHLDGTNLELPDVCKMSAVFADQYKFQDWDAIGGDPRDIEGKGFFDCHGYTSQTAGRVAEDHFLRRLLGEHPPMDPVSPLERFIMTDAKKREEYDDHMKMFLEPMGDLVPKSVRPLGDAPLWKDDQEMEGYRHSSGFVLLCFVPVGADAEKLFREVGYQDIVDGWRIMGFDSVGFWLPCMEKKILEAGSDEEVLRLFSRDKNAELDEASLIYKGGEFRSNLPSSYRVKETDCGNPDCGAKEYEKKMALTKEKTYQVGDAPGTRLLKCGRCQKIYYCSRKCQKDHWKRHKKVCNRKN